VDQLSDAETSTGSALEQLLHVRTCPF
jgi:hypothetical protein